MSSAPTVHVVSCPLDDALRRELIYEGELLIFKDVEPMSRLCALTDSLIRDALGTSEPVLAQFGLATEDYAERTGRLQKRYSKDAAVKRLFREALEFAGVSIDKTCWDRISLRAFPHSEELSGNSLGRLGIHRDTWGSNVYAQTNWWAPIYPLTAGRALAFYPAYWLRPIGNTSASWSLEKVRAARRAGDSSVPLVPELVEPLDGASELRVVIEPGDLLCFSGAHLHVGVPNSTGVARFSVETRTVDAEDAATGTGAPNVDGLASEKHPEWFHRVYDGTLLPEAVAGLDELILHEWRSIDYKKKGSSVKLSLMSSTNSKSSSAVQSVERAITVMELLSHQGWSGVTEVANEIGIHKSTAYRLLATLKNRGMVEQDSATEKYRLGFGVVLLASTVTADLDVVRYAKPVCERLSEETEETVTLTSLEGDQAVVIHQTISTSSMMNVDWSGWHTPLHTTAAGKVLLAHLPEHRRRAILRRPLENFTEHTVVDPARLREQLRGIRGTGYAYTIEELEVGMNAAGAPIRTADGEVVASVGVSGPAFRLPADSIQDLGELVMKAAEEISQRLGFYVETNHNSADH